MEVTKESIQKILYAFANKEIKEGTIEYETLSKLLNRHPKANEKIGVGMTSFYQN